ncbi:MAG: hypothetical protein R3F47_14835 [Gammaproteobacteria bacterium]
MDAEQEPSTPEVHQNRRQAALRRLRRQRQHALTRARKRMHR